MMLDDYKDKQLLTYNILVNEIKNDNITHAYLFDENNNSEAFAFVMAFVKSILCKDKKINNYKCDDCNLCQRIDDGNYPEIKIIEPDGAFVKKDQIVSLQQEFSRLAIEGHRKIYIIRECEKMRKETANSMLKFLEEPGTGIIAILMTNNFNNILPTIISRCQILKLNGDICQENNKELNNFILNFIDTVETKKSDAILLTDDIWFSKINVKDRDLAVSALNIMIDMYYDILKVKLLSPDIVYKDYLNEFKKISLLNKKDNILNKINYLVTCKDSIKCNVNMKLLIDSIIIDVGGMR